jgi:hypothetical protein
MQRIKLSRTGRRWAAGKPCLLCGLVLHHKDAVLLRTEDQQHIVHNACADIAEAQGV